MIFRYAGRVAYSNEDTSLDLELQDWSGDKSCFASL